MSNKQKQLEGLRTEIIDKVCKKEWRDVWFYPGRDGVKGYLGTQDIVFIGPNPSYNQFPTKQTDLFYKQLKVNGFRNAHLTDLIKRRLFSNETKELFQNKVIIDEQLRFLKREFEIIEPKLIVVLGKGKAIKNILEQNFRKIKIINIYHYSQRNPKHTHQFIKDIRKIKNQF